MTSQTVKPNRLLLLMAFAMASPFTFQPAALLAQTTLADAENVSAQTGRTLFVVAGRET